MAEGEEEVAVPLALSESQKKLIKESVSEKPVHFLGLPLRHSPPPDDTIHVLSEYITVLISNGKSQNQAARELEPFLGERSAEFVSRSWDFISKNFKNSMAITAASDIENVARLVSSDNNAARNKQVCEPAHNLINDEEASECLQGRHVFSSQTLDEEFIEDSMPMTHISPEREFNSSENEHNESLNYTLEGSPDGSKRSMQREKVHKTENAAGRRLFSRAAGAILNQHAKLPRTTVWDRLGRVSEPRDCVKVNVSGAKNNEIIDNNKFLQSLEDPKYCSRLSENSDIKLEGSAFDRKRQFNDLNPHSAGIYYSAADEGSCQYRGLLSEKDNKALFENALSFQAGRLKSQNYGSTFDVSTSSRSIKIPQEKLTAGSLDYVEGPISFVVPQAAKQTSKGDGDVATGGIKPMQAQLMGMKLRLHQMETEILNLQENIKDQNQGLLFSSSNRSKGSFFSHSQGDAESRTVVVTNVHLAATREAIVSYFSKCGAVDRVIKLNDIATSMGSAYVTFANMDSANKALALNGTLFFAQTIWVKKAGKPASTSGREQRSGSSHRQHWPDRIFWSENQAAFKESLA